jgi:magnesium-transporting ATPase (P-type)
MELAEIMESWKMYDRKLEESLLLNRKNAEEIIHLKIKSQLVSMKPIKVFTLIAGFIWVICGSMIVTNIFLFAFEDASKFFLFSATAQLLLTAIAIAIYIYQLVLISEVDISGPILETQKKLAGLRSSTLAVTRILFLQLPLWTTFYLTKGVFENGNSWFYIVQGIATFSFVYIALWLFFNIKYKNKDKKWFRLLFEGKEWTPVIKSMELLEEMKEYQ